jgi:hypothetical protein
MTASPLDPLYALLGPGLHQIAGTSVSGEIPIAQGLINRLLAEQLASSNAPVAAVQVELHDADTLSALVTLRASFVPPVRVVARIDQQPRLPGAPVVGLRWTLPGLGLLARVASPALALFKGLPPGIVVDGDRLLVHVGQMLASQGLGDVMRYLSSLQVTTRAGVLIVRFEVLVAGAASPPGARSDEPGS